MRQASRNLRSLPQSWSQPTMPRDNNNNKKKKKKNKTTSNNNNNDNKTILKNGCARAQAHAHIRPGFEHGLVATPDGSVYCQPPKLRRTQGYQAACPRMDATDRVQDASNGNGWQEAYRPWRSPDTTLWSDALAVTLDEAGSRKA